MKIPEKSLTGGPVQARFAFNKYLHSEQFMRAFSHAVGPERSDIAAHPFRRVGLIGLQNVGKTTLSQALVAAWPEAVMRQHTDALRPQAAYLISTAASGPNAGKYWVRHYDANCGPSYRLPISLLPDFWAKYKTGLDIVEHPERDFQEDFDYAFRLEYQPYKQYDGDLFVEFLCEPEELETPEIQKFLAEVSHLRAV